MRKKALCLVLFLFALSTVAHAQSTKIDPMKGAWSVTLADTSVVTWEILDNVFVSSTGSSHIGYGIKNPGNVEFEIYWSKYVQTGLSPSGMKYAYIEKPHADVVDYNDLPQEPTEYTYFTPAGDTNLCFNSFALAEAGPYSLQSGTRTDDACDNIVADNCTLQKIIPEKIGKLMALVQPVMPFIIIGSEDTEFPQGVEVTFDTEAIKPLIPLKIGKRLILAICLVRPFKLTSGDVTVTAGDCTGKITVR